MSQRRFRLGCKDNREPEVGDPHTRADHRSTEKDHRVFKVDQVLEII